MMQLISASFLLCCLICIFSNCIAYPTLSLPEHHHGNSWEVSPEQCPERCECSMKMSEHFQAYLRTIDCSEQGLIEFPANLPADVQVLLLRDNKIRHLFEKPLHLRDLVHLDLSHNLLRSWGSNNDQGKFREMYNMKILDLSHNRLTSVADHTFRGLFNLQEFNLADNQIAVLSEDCFAGLPKLETLRLSGNRLDYVHPAWWPNVRSLYNLHLDRNRFSLIQAEAFKALHNLRKLDLGKNKLERLGAEALVGLERLEILNLDYNSLYTVPRDSLSRVSSSLKSLNLNRNPISSLRTDDVANFASLRDLSFNNMHRLKLVERGALKNLPELVLVEMHDNPRFSYLDPLAFVNTPAISHILLHNNNLTVLSNAILAVSRDLQEISFYGNPLSCDCNAKWLKLYLLDQTTVETHSRQQQRKVVFRDADRMVCDSPIEQRFKLFSSLSTDVLDDRCIPWIVPLFNKTVHKKANEDVVLDCRAVGVPAPSITWLDPDGMVITTGAYHPRRILQNSDTLIIRRVQQEDHGRYTCVAENALGRAVVQIDVNVTVVQIDLSVVAITDRGATLKWQEGIDSSHRVFQILYRPLDTVSPTAGRRHDYAGTVASVLQSYRLENLRPITNYEACVAFKDDFDVVVHISCVQFHTKRPLGGANNGEETKARQINGERYGNLAVGVALAVVASMLIVVGLTAVIFATRSAGNNNNKTFDLFGRSNLDNGAYIASSTDNLSRTFSTDNMVAPLVYNKLVSISQLRSAHHV